MSEQPELPGQGVKGSSGRGTTRTTESIRWRGGQVTRIEALTDAVFGFAITLLVVSLEVPETFSGLLVMMRGFVAFAPSFALLILVWWYHYRLFSRYDLEDGITVFLNSILLFVVLFYIYPLKFVFRALLGDSATRGLGYNDMPLAMTIYGLGYVAVFLVFALLYVHAYRLRHRLGLTPLETIAAQQHVAECLIMAAVGMVSVGLAQIGQYGPVFSGFSYFLIGPAQYVNGTLYARRKQQLAVQRT